MAVEFLDMQGHSATFGGTPPAPDCAGEALFAESAWDLGTGLAWSGGVVVQQGPAPEAYQLTPQGGWNLGVQPPAFAVSFTVAAGGVYLYFTVKDQADNILGVAGSDNYAAGSHVLAVALTYTDPGQYIALVEVAYLAWTGTITNLGYYCEAPPAPPIAAFSIGTQTMLGWPTSLTDLSTGATSYLWDFGDGNTSTLAEPTHTWTQTSYTHGAYTISQTVTNAGGSDIHSQEFGVFVGFQHEYAFTNWAFDNGGTLAYSEEDADKFYFRVVVPAEEFGTMTYTMTAPISGQASFYYSLSSTYDGFMVSVDVTVGDDVWTPLVDSLSNPSIGTKTVTLTASKTFGIRITSDGSAYPAAIEIRNLNAPTAY